ncbi:acetyl-CoA carboxylase carboxyltransferase subunit [Candidatus Binatia bacterium]|nr:acetyl-CoA carboxylase carboxyltransferase subunit [Candidatus Binatia bacterium]
MANDERVPPAWRPILDDLERRHATARAMGGEARVARQHASGRLDVRQRIATLLDRDSFVELGALVGGEAQLPADGFVAGTGTIDGRDVLVGAEDFTVLGGSIGIRAHAKRYRIAELALQERRPLVMLLDGAGERAQNAFERYPRSPNDLQMLARLSGFVPTVVVILGPSAGHSALAAPLADFVVMSAGACAFTAGPPLVQSATGEIATKEELGGSAVHAASGLAHAVAADDASALTLARRYLGFFPSSAWQHPPWRAAGGRFGDAGERRLDAILDVIPADQKKAYDVHAVLKLLCDGGEILELQPGHGRSIVTALAHLGGEPVAIVASQPMVRAGAIDGEAAEKAARFLEIADAFHLPAVFLADTPGVQVGKAAERQGILRRAMRMFAAQSWYRGVKIHVTLRKVYGVASCLMAMNPFDGQTTTLAFPTGRIAAMPATGASDAVGADDELRRQLAESEMVGVYRPADGGSYDDVIDPRELRNRVLHALRVAVSRRDEAPAPVARCGVLP